MKERADILVVGAGPAGLALALQAHAHGAVVRVIDRRPEADRPSRALIMHSRTLEVLRPLGVTQALLTQADIAPMIDLRLGPRVTRVTLADLAVPGTAFPHLSLTRQLAGDVLQYALSCPRFQLDFKHPERDEVQGGHFDLRVADRYHAAAESFVVGRGSAAVFPGYLSVRIPEKPETVRSIAIYDLRI